MSSYIASPFSWLLPLKHETYDCLVEFELFYFVGLLRHDTVGIISKPCHFGNINCDSPFIIEFHC